MELLLKLLPPALLEKYLGAILAGCGVGAMTIWAQYQKLKTAKREAAANKPVAPMPIPPTAAALPASVGHPLDLPRAPTKSTEFDARLSSLEREQSEQEADYKRRIWDLQEEIRRLERRERERSKEHDDHLREIGRLRFENNSLKDDVERKDQKIDRLQRRLHESPLPQKLPAPRPYAPLPKLPPRISKTRIPPIPSDEDKDG